MEGSRIVVGMGNRPRDVGFYDPTHYCEDGDGMPTGEDLNGEGEESPPPLETNLPSPRGSEEALNN